MYLVRCEVMPTPKKPGDYVGEARRSGRPWSDGQGLRMVVGLEWGDRLRLEFGRWDRFRLERNDHERGHPALYPGLNVCVQLAYGSTLAAQALGRVWNKTWWFERKSVDAVRRGTHGVS